MVAPNFTAARWDIYTSPTTDNKSAELLTPVDKQLAHQCQIVCADPRPGRLQHLRLLNSSWTADVLNVRSEAVQLPSQNRPRKFVRRFGRRFAGSCKPCLLGIRFCSSETITLLSSRLRPRELTSAQARAPVSRQLISPACSP